MKSREYEHSHDLREAQALLVDLRSRIKRLHWISGGYGYDNMGARELEQARVKLDELEFWVSAASRSLAAGGRRAQVLGFRREAGEDAA